MEPTASSSSRAAWLRVLAFTLATASLAGILSWVVRPWIDLPWWRIFRRCVSISAAISLVAMLRFVDRKPFQALGLGPWSSGVPYFLRGLLLGTGAVALVGGFYLIGGACQVSVHPDTWRVWRTVIGFLPAAFLVAVLEECIFRGYILHQLLAYSPLWAILGSSVSYAVVHLKSSFAWPATMLELIGLWILGVVLAISRLRTGQLYLAIGLHAVLAYCARVNKLLIAFPESSITWLIGTNRLVNGAVAWLILGLIGWVIVRWESVSHQERQA